MVSARMFPTLPVQPTELLSSGSAWSGARLIQPMWQGVSLIVDEFTRSAFGEIIIHAILLANFAITRKAQWSKRSDATRVRLKAWKRYIARLRFAKPRIRTGRR